MNQKALNASSELELIIFFYNNSDLIGLSKVRRCNNKTPYKISDHEENSLRWLSK